MLFVCLEKGAIMSMQNYKGLAISIVKSSLSLPVPVINRINNASDEATPTVTTTTIAHPLFHAELLLE